MMVIFIKPPQWFCSGNSGGSFWGVKIPVGQSNCLPANYHAVASCFCFSVITIQLSRLISCLFLSHNKTNLIYIALKWTLQQFMCYAIDKLILQTFPLPVNLQLHCIWKRAGWHLKLNTKSFKIKAPLLVLILCLFLCHFKLNILVFRY